MKRVFFLSILIYNISCNNSEKQNAEKKSDSDIDAARNFLNASLKGDFREASAYMLQDSTNSGYLFNTQRLYKTNSEKEKTELKEASLHFYEPSQRPNDSTTIIIFSNSYKNDRDTLKLVRIAGRWLVDLKYLFEHDRDTLFNKMNKIDTINQ